MGNYLMLLKCCPVSGALTVAIPRGQFHRPSWSEEGLGIYMWLFAPEFLVHSLPKQQEAVLFEGEIKEGVLKKEWTQVYKQMTFLRRNLPNSLILIRFLVLETPKRTLLKRLFDTEIFVLFLLCWKGRQCNTGKNSTCHVFLIRNVIYTLSQRTWTT